jgi:acetate kinase
VRVLVVNAGSSSLKLALLDDNDTVLHACELQAPHARVDDAELRAALDSPLGGADAVGHRIVHGGERFRNPVRVDAAVARALHELVDLAPLHQPKSLAALRAVTEILPDRPAVACFDTAFHATLPEAAYTYALPARWREGGLRRYGFHGLSHAWVARRIPALLARNPTGLRIVSCHLGAGASLCAIENGHSIDTTMGFTPLEGLVMATRSGSVDPGMLMWLLEHDEVTVSQLADALEHDSGLLGLAGSADMREIVERDAAGDAPAQLALDVYIHRLTGAIAAMTTALGGIDVLAFTGGVGEHSPELRRRTASRLSFLGVHIDEDLNTQTDGDGEIGAEHASAHTLVLTAREDIEIATQVRAVL